VPLHTRERGVSSWVVNISVRLIGLDGDGSSKKALIPRCLSATAIQEQRQSSGFTDVGAALPIDTAAVEHRIKPASAGRSENRHVTVEKREDQRADLNTCPRRTPPVTTNPGLYQKTPSRPVSLLLLGRQGPSG
jgi:hypothetical protein